MAAPQRMVELAFSDEEAAELARLARSRTEPASRVERARMLLDYRQTPSFYAVGRDLGVTHQTVERCVRRAERLGVLAALDDSPRPGREPVITGEARTFVVDLACRKAKDLGYPHELSTTRLLAKHVREHGPRAGHECLATLAQGTLCKILAAHEVKPHKVRYYLERRDPEFDAKMAEVLCVYREVQLLKQAALAQEGADLPPAPSRHACLARDHEYVRHGTLSLLAGIDLLTGVVHASVEERHRSREFVAFLQKLDAAYPPSTAIKLILDNHSAHVSKETRAWLAAQPMGGPFSTPIDRAASAPRPLRAGGLGLRVQSARHNITAGQKAMGHALLFPLVRGLSRCLTKPLTQWNGK